MLKRISVGLLAIIIFAFCLELGERFEIPGVLSFVSTAEAVIGRPLTPMSVAGVARRSDDGVQRASTARPGDRWDEAGLNQAIYASRPVVGGAGEVSCRSRAEYGNPIACQALRHHNRGRPPDSSAGARTRRYFRWTSW